MEYTKLYDRRNVFILAYSWLMFQPDVLSCTELRGWRKVNKQDVIIIIIFVNCNWVLTLWQWLFYVYTNVEKKVTREFKSGELHERHVVATWNLGNHLSIRL
jgi:hypothetical protein